MLNPIHALAPPVAANRNHFSQLANKVKAECASFAATHSDLSEKIAEATCELAEIEATREDAFPKGQTKEQFRTAKLAELRILKQQRANEKRPINFSPDQEISKYLDAKMLSETFVAATVPNPIKKGEGPNSAHVRLKAETDRILRDISATTRAPKPDAVRVTAIRDQIEALAAIGAPTLDKNGRLILKQMAISTGGGVPTMDAKGKPGQLRAAGGALIDDVAGFVAWACKDQLIKACEALVQPFEGISLTDEDRELKLAEMKSDLLDALRAENFAAIEAEKLGQRVERRRHVHPLVLVGAEASPDDVYTYLSRQKGI